MSETVHYRGTLKECKRSKNETLEDQCRRLLKDKEFPSYYDSYQEMLLDEHYKEFIVNNDILYSVEKEEIDFDEDIFVAKVNNDGEGIDFEVKYYNGGCGFREAIEKALGNMRQ